MIGVSGGTALGKATVVTTDFDNHSPDKWASLAVNKIISISVTTPDALKYQATQYKAQIQNIIANTVASALIAERQTIAFKLAAIGMTEAAELLRKDLV